MNPGVDKHRFSDQPKNTHLNPDLNPEAFHQSILNEVIEKLNQKNLVLIKGPSRSGKTTFLKNTLIDTIQKNGQSAVYCNSMANLPEEIVASLQSEVDFVLIDEFYRLSSDLSTVFEALDKRLKNGKKVVLCGTTFHELEDENNRNNLLESRLSLLEESVICFPLNMSKEDAKKVIQHHIVRLDGDPSEFSELINQLVTYTTNPNVLASIIADLFFRKVIYEPDFKFEPYLKDALENRLYFERGLQQIANEMRQKLNIT